MNRFTAFIAIELKSCFRRARCVVCESCAFSVDFHIRDMYRRLVLLLSTKKPQLFRKHIFNAFRYKRWLPLLLCGWCREISFDRKCNMHVEPWKPLLSQAAKNKKKTLTHTTEYRGNGVNAIYTRMFDQILHSVKWTPPTPRHIIWHTF